MTTREINLLHRDLYIKHGPEWVDLISTHASWVLLTPEFAYKIKKPVQFSFLDYSTLEKREAACWEEMRLNKELAKNLYLDVVEIREEKNRYTLEGSGTNLIDFALKMKRMNPKRQMDILLHTDQVSAEDVLAIAENLTLFHQKAERRYDVVDLDTLKNQFNDIAVILPFLEKHFPEEASSTIENSIELSDQFLAQHLDRLLERQAKGWVIDGHGDLHSRNIFLMKKPVIFDRIEFNEAFRLMDILSEIAFFCMDLHFFGRQDLAAHFLQRYFQLIPCIEDIKDWNIFHYFKLYRANVRLKVSGLNAMQAQDEAELQAIIPAVKAYLHLYRYYLKALS
ncbi:MAG: hypothetical protein Sapg2KO_19610 [Saprospiraceae bacterium]